MTPGMRSVSIFVLLAIAVAARAAEARVGGPLPALMPARLGLMVAERGIASATYARGETQALVPDATALLRARLPVRPVDGEIASPFGVRKDPLRRRRHSQHLGCDLEARRGTDVRAAGAGVVVRAGSASGYGRLIVIDNGDGVETWYAHLSRYKVKKGDVVLPGQVIGKSGATGRVTGPHLHFEVRIDGQQVDPAQVL
jgi:murein DD-endopeptidase MepM/ murein hydrolase activator NlpD